MQQEQTAPTTDKMVDALLEMVFVGALHTLWQATKDASSYFGKMQSYSDTYRLETNALKLELYDWEQAQVWIKQPSFWKNDEVWTHVLDVKVWQGRKNEYHFSHAVIRPGAWIEALLQLANEANTERFVQKWQEDVRLEHAYKPVDDGLLFADIEHAIDRMPKPVQEYVSPETRLIDALREIIQGERYEDI
jgi:hypothetical protein